MISLSINLDPQANIADSANDHTSVTELLWGLHWLP